MRLAVGAMLAAGLLAGCAEQGRQGMEPRNVPLPKARRSVAKGADTEQWRTEPVIFNGRRYTVSFRKTGRNTRLAKVRAPGRRLGTSRGDGRIVAEVAASTVHHFTCRDSQRAGVLPGSLRPAHGAWLMTITCR